jgi:hypothetical protein
MNRIFIPFLCLLFVVFEGHSASIAVFPIQGVNVDKSFMDAFGALLANKYEKFSGEKTIPPTKAGRAIGPDSNLTTAAQNLAADEYLEINAVGLYLSRTEYKETAPSDNRVVIINKEEDDDDDDDQITDKDQQLLDNSKTIVTVTRFDKTGKQIYKTEMTLLTYGDIEESTERIALSLIKKVSIEETRGMTNITRREGIGNNRLFVLKSKGPKFGLIYPFSVDGDNYEFSSIFSIGFDYRAESEKFFIEFGGGGRIPSGIEDSLKRNYGGGYVEVGGSYYIINKSIGVYAGLGIIPQFMILSSTSISIAPYTQFGVTFPRNSRVRLYADLRISQHVMKVKTGDDPYDYDYSGGSSQPPIHKDYPTEIGFQFGVGF